MPPREYSEYKITKENLASLRESKKDNVHIISAGSGVRNFNWQSIRGNDIMTINDTIFYLPLPITYHIYNEPYEKEMRNYDRMTKNYPFVHKLTTFPIPKWHQLPIYNDKNIAFMLALNVANDLGYKRVYLYGYDFKCVDGYVHWWDKEPETDTEKLVKKDEFLLKQKKIFEEMIVELQDNLDIILVKDI